MLEGWKPLRRCNLAIAAHDIWRCQEKRSVPTAVNKQLRNSSKHCNVYIRQCGNKRTLDSMNSVVQNVVNPLEPMALGWFSLICNQAKLMVKAH